MGGGVVPKDENEPLVTGLNPGALTVVVFEGRDAIKAKLTQFEDILGPAVGEPEQIGTGVKWDFQRGIFYWRRDLGAFEVHGDILDMYGSLNGHDSFLGFPVTDVNHMADAGQFTLFEHGAIYFHPDVGAHEVHGAIRERWSTLGDETGLLGYPTGNEMPLADGVGRVSHFQSGSIFWHPDIGAHEVHGPMRDRWIALGADRSYLGYPATDVKQTVQGTQAQGFQRGELHLFTEGSVVLEVPDAVEINSGPIVTNETVGGSVVWQMNSRGDWHWEGHMHNSGFFGLNVVVVTGPNFVDGAGHAFIAPPSEGFMSGTDLEDPDHRNLDWTKSGNSPVIRDNWDVMRSAGVTTHIEIDATVATAIGAYLIVFPVIVVGLLVVGVISFLASGPKKTKACPRHMAPDGHMTEGSLQFYDEGSPEPPCPPDTLTT